MLEKKWPAVLESIPRITEEVTSIAMEAGCSRKQALRLETAIEELATNVVKYAFPDGEPGFIELTVEPDSGQITLHLADSGAPFNPLEVPDPDLSTDIRQRSIGGLGIFMTKKLVDEIVYTRTGDRNILRIVKKF